MFLGRLTRFIVRIIDDMFFICVAIPCSDLSSRAVSGPDLKFADTFLLARRASL